MNKFGDRNKKKKKKAGISSSFARQPQLSERDFIHQKFVFSHSVVVRSSIVHRPSIRPSSVRRVASRRVGVVVARARIVRLHLCVR